MTFKIGDAGSLAFALLHVDQILVGVLAEIAQFVELGVIAGAITPPSRISTGGLSIIAVCRQLQYFRLFAQLLAQMSPDADSQYVAKLGLQVPAKLPMSGASTNRSRGRAVFKAIRELMRSISPICRRLSCKSLVELLVQQSGDAGVTAIDDGVVAQGSVYPAPQTSAAHGRGGFVQHAQQGKLHLSAGMAIQFQIPAAGGIQADAVLAVFDADALNMRQGALLGIAHILQQATRRANRRRQMLAAEAF